MPEKPHKEHNNFVRYSGLGFQMVGVFVAAIWLGSYLDDKAGNEKPLITLLCLLLAVASSIYLVIKGLNN